MWVTGGPGATGHSLRCCRGDSLCAVVRSTGAGSCPRAVERTTINHSESQDSQAGGLFDPVEIGGHTGIVLHAVRIVAGVPPRRCHTDLFPIRDLGTPGVTVPGRTGVTL